MEDDIYSRMKVINDMLLEMASGNFHYRINRTSNNDDMEALIVTLNMLSEEIQDTIIHQGFIGSNKTSLDIVQMSFLLNNREKIVMVNQQTCNILSRLSEDIVGKSFSTLLTKSSREAWVKLFHKIKNKEIFDTSINLKFRTKGNLVIPKIAHITTFKNSTERSKFTLISVIHHTNFQTQRDTKLKNRITGSLRKAKPLKSKLRLSFEDIQKIREGHDIILNNLEKDLPYLKDFALQIGTNEFKLKYGFKELYGTTVHRFLMQERLRKAQMMIQFSDVSIKSIAYMVGFKSTPHFSRSFKKRYGYSPSELRKTIISE